MSFDFTEYYTLASELSCEADREACQRSAISRAYYAAFHKALELLEAEGRYVRRRNSEDHANVRELIRSKDADRRKISNNLKRLMDHRHDADYEIDPKEEFDIVGDLLACQETLDLIARYRQRAPGRTP